MGHRQASALGQAGCYSSADGQCRRGYDARQQGGGWICCPERAIDPLLDVAITSAGEILAQNDAQARETAQLVRRLVAAPPPPWSGIFGKREPARISKISDLNGALKVAVWTRENPTAVVLGALAIPVVSFLLGRLTATRPAT